MLLYHLSSFIFGIAPLVGLYLFDYLFYLQYLLWWIGISTCLFLPWIGQLNLCFILNSSSLSLHVFFMYLCSIYDSGSHRVCCISGYHMMVRVQKPRAYLRQRVRATVNLLPEITQTDPQRNCTRSSFHKAMFQRDPRAGAFLGGDRVSGQDIRDQNGMLESPIFLVLI
jgi:hypothetical protein